MIGVEEQPDHVGWCEVVAAGEDRDDTVGVRVEGADEDVQVCRVIGDFRDGRELRRSAFAGSPLLEFGDGRRLAPHGVVVAAVYDGLLCGVCRGDAPCRKRRRVPPALRRGGGGCRGAAGQRGGGGGGATKETLRARGGFL